MRTVARLLAARVHLLRVLPLPSVRCISRKAPPTNRTAKATCTRLPPAAQKRSLVGRWAPTSKSAAFGAWRERLLYRQVSVSCTAPRAVVHCCSAENAKHTVLAARHQQREHVALWCAPEQVALESASIAGGCGMGPRRPSVGCS
jgi:hypothetical protein